MIEVVNRQRKMPLDCERWQKFVEKTWQFIPTKAEGVTVAFCFRSSNARTESTLASQAGND